MRRPISLTLRLTLLFSAAATVVLLTFGWIVGRSMEHHFKLEDSRELHDIAASVAQALATSDTRSAEALIRQRFDDLLVGHHHALLHSTSRTSSAAPSGS